MIKKSLCALVVLFMIGCSYGKEHVESMLDNPPGILEDSLYVRTQKQLDKLESQYLNNEISYAEYMEKKTDLEASYKKVADHRSGIVEGSE